MTGRRRYVGVVGPGSEVESGLLEEARCAGRLLGQAGCVVLTGGLGGVMEAASRGAHDVGGLTVGLLPGGSRTDANRYLTVSLPTGMGELRNALLVRGCEALLSFGGSWGTLTEVALAVRTGVPVVAVGGWHLPGGPEPAPDAAAAVRRVLELLP